MRTFFLLLLVVLALSSCSPHGGKPRSAYESAPSMTKDQVAIVGSRGLSISAYLLVKSSLRGAPPESVLWVGLASLVLQNEAQARGVTLSAPLALSLAKYCILEATPDQARSAFLLYLPKGLATPDPETFHKVIDELLAHSVVQKNTQVLAELH